jgi:hypothetical protein
MTATDKLPPRKPVTAWGAEVGYDDDPPFVILTLHHGLGKMTRVDLDPDDCRDIATLLTSTAKEARQ